MHPAIKIVSLVILTIFSTQGGWLTLLLCSLFLLPYYLLHFEVWSSAIKMLLRLKWFFLSIFFLYYYYAPITERSIVSWDMLLNEPSMVGLLRISILIVIIFAVNLFLKTSTKEEILSALLWLFSPLQFFQINVTRLSLRAILTLEYIEKLSLHLSLYKKKYKLERHSNSHLSFLQKIKEKKQSFFHLVKHSGIILHEILNEAEGTSGKSYSIYCLSMPSAKQVLFPLLLCFSLYLTL